MAVRIKKDAFERRLERRNIDKGELAAELGTSRNYLSQLLAGEHSPRPAFRRRLMDALEVTEWDELFENDRGEAVAA